VIAQARVRERAQATLPANNFDLIRLCAALQVGYVHCANHFRTLDADRPLSTLASLFPGVPVFFFISGYLISLSFERNPSWRDYARNRALRIYPATWLCGFFADKVVPPEQFFAWVAAQLTIGQFYNPAFISQPPIWALNGSTWTISVELQFYVLVPLLYGAVALARLPRPRSNLVLLALAALFLALNEVWPGKEPGYGGALGPQLPAALFVPWFWMFLVGVLFQRNSVVLGRWLAGRFVYVALAYVLLASFALHQWQWSLKDSPQPLLFLGLACVTFSAAFSAPALSQRLLRRNDVSYGFYIYHEPVINVLLLTGAATGRAALILAIVVSLVLACASWVLIERPALALKRHPLYVHADRG